MRPGTFPPRLQSDGSSQPFGTLAVEALPDVTPISRALPENSIRHVASGAILKPGREQANMDSTEGATAFDRDSISAVTVNFSETSQLLLSAGNVTATLHSVVDFSVSAIEGCDLAGLFLIDGVAVTAPVHTDPIVVEIHALQQQTDEGALPRRCCPPSRVLRRRFGQGPPLASLRSARDRGRDTQPAGCSFGGQFTTRGPQPLCPLPGCPWGRRPSESVHFGIVGGHWSLGFALP